MRYPEFLKENGTIGFAAPSFGCNIQPYRAAFENALKKWREDGFSTVLGSNCLLGDGIGISSTPQNCGKELETCYLDNKSDCLISCGGGELMCEILEYVDFKAIREGKPKWFMGYSDNTNMTFLLTTLCDTASIYGPCAAAFGMEPRHQSLLDAMDVLMGRKRILTNYDKWEKEGIKDEEHPLLPYHCTEDSQIRCYLPQGGAKGTETIMTLSEDCQMEGRLIGGCMDCLVNLLGTRFDRVKDFVQKYKEDGFIWFLESCDLNVFAIRRAMWQMEHAGWFEHAKGFLIGRPLVYGQEMMGLDQYEAVLPTARKRGIPVIMDADLGHLPPAMPLVTGSFAKIQSKNGGLEIEMIFK
ncbi:MAG: LD-carboxypeptidase [Lachnospiraceae bacterium]|nr:LD-carboxypeptidase [Lachnospiraceae bacterium]